MPEKRYNLALPEELFNELKAEADARGVTMLDLIKRALKLLFLVIATERDGGAVIFRDSDGNDKQIMFM